MEQLRTPAYIPAGARFRSDPAPCHLIFDGGSTLGKGTAGYVIIDTVGDEICRVGIQIGEGVTNNEAEATAVSKGM
jgi:ribonuclease HI